MRSFLRWIVLVAILGAAAYVVAPIVAQPLVADAVRAVSPFGAAPLAVDVRIDPLELLAGKIKSVHVTGSNLTDARVHIDNLDVTGTEVAVLDHSFASMTGTLEGVALRRSDGTELQARQVELSGPADAVVATATVSRTAALEIVSRALEGAGLPANNLELTNGGVRISVLGQKTDVALGAVNGSVAIAGSIAGGNSIVVFGPEPGDPWRISGVAVSPDGLKVDAVLDLGALLGGR